ncbi:MAG: hypothetical protein NTY64_10495 [Deltaproteobacteria bacterium]|nr:hypothetical protein [Deltaproteobacteria bacterium]
MNIEGKSVNPPEERIRIFQNQTGEKNLRVLGEEGKWVTYYSTRDIQGEMSSFAANLEVPENHIPILLGLGLGYHLREILKKSSEPVVVVEKDRGIYQLACSEGVITDLLQNPKVVFIVGKEMADAIQEISRKQLQLGLKNFRVFKHQPSLRCFPSFYETVAEKLQQSQQVKIGSRLKYQKFQSEQLRILLINSQYLMMGELSRAIQNLGHSLRTLVIEREAEMAQSEFMAGLLRVLMDFKPDFILTVNHLGFDREGIVTDFLTTLEIPFAS